jgi:protein TonB
MRYGWATVSMIFGSTLVFTSLVVMNELSQAPERAPEVQATEFEVQKLVEPPKKRESEHTSRTSKSQAWRPPAALQGLESSLAGVDVGLPALELGNVVQPAESILGAARELVMTGEAVDTPPRPTRRTAIDYPKLAKTKGIQGYVVLNLLIGPSGQVEQVKVLESTPPDVFEQAAVDGVRLWQFEPGLYKGQRVKVWARQTIRFDLS